jgi:hypothetical protein
MRRVKKMKKNKINHVLVDSLLDIIDLQDPNV